LNTRTKIANCLRLFGALALMLVATAAHADPADEARAVERGYSALELYNARHWQAAFDAFAEAERLSHSPVFGLYMARCRSHQGQLVAALDLYARVTAEPPDSAAPGAFRSAFEDAGKEQRALRARIPRLRLTVPDGVVLTSLELDGAVLPPERIAQELDLDPGDHRVLATDRAQRSVTVSVHLSEGQVLTTRLEFPPEAPALSVKPAPPVRRAAPASAAVRPVTRHLDAVSITLLAAGGVGVLAGAVTGAIALSESSAITANCRNQHCPESDRARGERAETLATVSTLGFAVGGGALAAGGAWFWFSPQLSSDQASLSGGSLQARGRF
jgi:hypothetical protein